MVPKPNDFKGFLRPPVYTCGKMSVEGNPAPTERSHMATTYKCSKCNQKITLHIKASTPPTCAANKHRFHPTIMEVAVPPKAKAL